ncbi:hypothetical protein GW17_00051876 [Ensete ventricosum]|nr:hypothetical protein GW17_00051876 [Ensete ventricosum]
MYRNLPPRHRGIVLFYKGCPNPSFPFASPLPLRRQRLPLLAGSRPAKGQPPVPLVSPHLLAVAPCGCPVAGPLCEHRATSGCAGGRLPALRAGRSRSCTRAVLLPASAAPAGCCPYGRHGPPFRAGPGRSLPPPCRGPWLWHGRGWPPLLLAVFAAKM